MEKVMRAQLFEEYYKNGINHYLFKNLFGLHKPDRNIKRFYYALIIAAVIVGNLIAA